MVVMVVWVGGISQNTPAKETPIKGTFVKNEGWWGVGEKLGTVEDGGWWRGGLQTPILPGGAGGCGYILFAQIFALPHISCNITKEENIQEFGNT